MADPEGIPWTGDPWIIAEWPDGTWCNREDIELYTYMSDDYQLAVVDEYDPNGYCPTKTHPVEIL